ncbi:MULTISPECIES: GNAT family N-acetyltransferase [unclassified Streptomyces]|uniref:GNAT family N-acetyltransferase n=1 Tax=unclassified Streptomyces TaxID=2593676 RepID=UPI00166124EC|nr:MULTISPECIES: GNAT family protein [unclassified Streptomyces]MBD0708991.1 GNAT family N-acetyltransferase [Streptomyces sp. CBMA291]MBD0716670.1 GNAT family N-acetyltransferase [Streptomyces sp. CBMA370]
MTECTRFSYKPTLTGDLVVLRPPAEDDVAALSPMFQDPETARLTGMHTVFGEAALRRWYGSRGEQDDRLDLVVVERATGAVVGEVVLNEWDEPNESCAFRICFTPAGTGRGLGTEATRLILGHAFEGLGLHRVWLEVYAFNPRARHIYEKAGFRAEGVLRGALLWAGERVDATVMSILAPEWAARQAVG